MKIFASYHFETEKNGCGVGNAFGEAYRTTQLEIVKNFEERLKTQQNFKNLIILYYKLIEE